MARRGFFAELQYQNQQAEKRRRQYEAANYRAHVRAQREAERASLAANRARAAAARASEAERARLAKEAAQLHVESRLAEVEPLNAGLATVLGEIDGMLAATFEVDDFVDLEALKITSVEHPPFDPGVLAVRTPEVQDLVCPQEPVYQEPPAPGGLFGRRRSTRKQLCLPGRNSMRRR